MSGEYEESWKARAEYEDVTQLLPSNAAAALQLYLVTSGWPGAVIESRDGRGCVVSVPRGLEKAARRVAVDFLAGWRAAFDCAAVLLAEQSKKLGG